MDTIIVLVIIGVIVALAAWYVYRSKKKGQKCIGCPSGGHCEQCHGHCENHSSDK